MKIMYLRKSNIFNSFLRQNYLISNDKQEHLLFSSSLDDLLDFKNINKELVLELPNELNDVVLNSNTSFNDIHDLYVNKFKQLTGYDNVSMAIHFNSSKTNLHAHLSYVDRHVITKYHVAKKDMYVYTSTGKRLKKQDYNEANPNHLLIKKGEQLLDYSNIDHSLIQKYKDDLSINSSLSVKEQFELRRHIKDTYKKIDTLEYSKCLESGLSLLEQKKLLNSYKEEFKEFNNELLADFGFKPKYVDKDSYTKFGFETKKKIGKVNDKLNTIQKNNIKYNKIIDEYNESLLELIQNKDIKKDLRKNLVKEEVQRKQEYNKKNTVNKYKEEKLNHMIKKLMNLKEGIDNINNLIEAGKEYVKEANKRVYEKYQKTFEEKKRKITKTPNSKNRDRGPTL